MSLIADLFASLLVLIGINKQNLQVCFDSGCALGVQETGINRSFDAWYGIPYAEPPIGDLRFKDPRPVKPWNNLYNATYPRSQCVQLDFARRGFSGSEDCLFLNVYRPNRTRNEPLPVLVFIHGGSFKGGSIHPHLYGPGFVMDTQEVIFVSIQYRLGVFGFLAANDVECKGNFGLKDQNLALRWIKRNIHKFGGDPLAVTLMGQSAGAASVHHQMLSKGSNGLFHRAILFSGSALAFWATDRRPQKLFREYSKLAGITENSSITETMKVLRKMSSEELLLAEWKTPLLHPAFYVFRPVIEGNWAGAFIRADPECVLKGGNYEQRPILTGIVGFEQGVFIDLHMRNSTRNFITTNWKSFFSKDLELPVSGLETMRDFYQREHSCINILQLIADRSFNYPMYKTIELHSKFGNLQKNAMNLYRFNFSSSISTAVFSNEFYAKDKGVSHGDELLYLLPMKVFEGVFKGGSPESEMKDYFVKLVVDYAKNRTEKWSQVKPCDKGALESGFCGYLDIQRESNHVKVSPSRNFNLEMAKVHKLVDDMSSMENPIKCD